MVSLSDNDKATWLAADKELVEFGLISVAGLRIANSVIAQSPECNCWAPIKIEFSRITI
jgi:hypothetical protein